MSYSRSTRRLLSVAAFALLAAAFVALSPGPAAAYEGVQGKYVIFYPSIDFTYEHTDNLYYTPDNEVSANTWLVRPHLKLEVPHQKHYFMIEYAPTFRDNDEVDLVEDWDHVIDMKARFKATPLLDIRLEDEFVVGVYELQHVDPGYELPYSLDPYTANQALLAFDFAGVKQSATVRVGQNFHDWDRDVVQPGYFDQETWFAGFEYGYRFRTLTRFLLGYDFEDSNQEYLIWNLGVPDLDSDSNTIYVGFDGEFGRTTTGAVRFGYQNRDFDIDSNSDYSGLWLDGTVDKAFTRYTKLEVNVHRSEQFSNFDNNAFYTANRLGLQLINQPLGRKIFWAVRAGYQRNDYPDPAPLYDNIHRQDDLLLLDGEVGFHPLTHLNFKINYRHEERDSNIDSLSYTADHWLFQLSVGF